MHLILIIAFASLLWFGATADLNMLNLGPTFSIAVVILESIALLLATVYTTRRTLRILQDHPEDPNDAQHYHHFASMILQIALLVFFIGNLLLTGWPEWVKSLPILTRLYGGIDLAMLVPLILTVILMWIIQYPADRSIRELALNPRLMHAQPVHPVWNLREYLSFNVRYHILTVAVPMVIIILGDDILNRHRSDLRAWSGGLPWISDALMGVLVAAVFVFAPVLMRYIWPTEPIPPGELRENLESIARRMNLKYRELLIWHSRGMVVNAAVMGLFAPVRYVLISDGLLESMTDKQIEAVFGHEAGHVKYWHIPYFIVFATLTMLVAGGLIYVLQKNGPAWMNIQHIQLIVGLVVVLMWGFVFGWLSHQFEHQADISGAMCMVPGNTEDAPDEGPGLHARSAEQFGTALKRVAALNGIPSDERGWRHPAIDDRIAFLKQMSEDPVSYDQFMRSVSRVKHFMILATVVSMAVGLYLYWDYWIPRNWLN